MTEVKARPEQSVAELSSRLGISRSQFYKDKQLLSELGFSFERKNGRFILNEETSLPITNLSISERMALLMAIRQLAASGETFLSYHGLQAAKKLVSSMDTRWREATRVLFDNFVLREGFGCDRDVLERLQQACLESRRIILEYSKPNSAQATSYTFDPYVVFFQDRSMYVEGYCVTRKDFRCFRISRIRSLQQTGMKVPKRTDYDFRTRHKGTFGVFSGQELTEVVVRFAPRVSQYIRESLWHHSQEIQELTEGGIEYRVRVTEPREVMWWSFRWGDGAEILEPDWLREEAKGTIRRMMRRYEG